MDFDELEDVDSSILFQFNSKLQELTTLASQLAPHLKARAHKNLDDSYAKIQEILAISSLPESFGAKEDLVKEVSFTNDFEVEAINAISETIVPDADVRQISAESKVTLVNFSNNQIVEKTSAVTSVVQPEAFLLTHDSGFLSSSNYFHIQDGTKNESGEDKDVFKVHGNYKTVDNSPEVLTVLNENVQPIDIDIPAHNHDYVPKDQVANVHQEGCDENDVKADISNEQEEDFSKEDLSDMSSLLTFLPQLSPYIKFDMKDGDTGNEKEGFLHLTVERADGSIQNLKLGGVVAASPGEVQQQVDVIQQNTPDTVKAEQNVTLKEEADGLQKEVTSSPIVSDGSDLIDSKGTTRSRGRPKKQAKYHAQKDEHGQKVYVCSVCGDSVRSEHALTVHLRKHTGDRPFCCQYCGKSFTTKGNAKAHEATHSEDKPWTCQFCQKSFKDKKVLKIHLRKHTGEKPFKCSTCDKAFSQKSVLKEHVLVHTGQKPHLCDLCGQEFRGLSSLRAHTLRHMNKRDFKCDKCDKDFVSKNDLNRHYMTHTGARPFACHVCPKTFTRLNYLKEHLNVHNGCKPFSCQFCSASFADSMSLHRHRRKHRLEEEEEDGMEKIVFQSELEKELLSAGNHSAVADDTFHRIEISDSGILGESTTSVQVILDENTKADDLQRLQSLVLSAASNADFTFNLQQTSKQLGHVMCVNPDTQDITDSVHGHQLIITGQNSADFSAINLLAAATAQQYNI